MILDKIAFATMGFNGMTFHALASDKMTFDDMAIVDMQ
jgi:hypothetical protein